MEAAGGVPRRFEAQDFEALTELSSAFRESAGAALSGAVAATDQLLSESDPRGLARLVDEAAAGPAAADWSPGWWETERQGSSLIRIGQLTQVGGVALRKHRFPALIPLIQAGNFIAYDLGDTAETRGSVLRSLLFRALACQPPGQLQVGMFDAYSLGGAFASFSRLQGSFALLGGRTRTSTPEMHELLGEIEQMIARIQADCLAGQFADLAEYNSQTDFAQEPYRLLAIHEAPHGLDLKAVEALRRIMSAGPAAGVHVAMTVDGAADFPSGISVTDLAQNAHVAGFDPETSGWWLVGGADNVQFEPDEDPPTALMVSLLDRVAEGGSTAQRVDVPLRSILPSTDEFWRASSADGVEVPIGMKGRELQWLRLGSAPVNGLIAGQTGQGKSNLLHALIASLAARYGPHELALYLLDFKQVEFAEYAGPNALPHAKLVAVEAEREFGLSAIQHLAGLMQDRFRLLRESGVQSLQDFRAKANDMPRIVVILDEFQALFEEDDEISRESSRLLAKLARQGRAVGIHLLLATQTLAGLTNVLAAMRQITSQVGLRIALKSTADDSRLILSESNAAAASLARQGEAIYNDQSGAEQGNTRFQVALADAAQRAELRTQLHSRIGAEGPAPPLTFRGGAFADPVANSELRRRVEDPVGDGQAGEIWLGSPVAVAPPLSTRLRRESGSHLAIVGDGAEAANGILQTACVSLAVGGQSDATFNIADLSEDADADPHRWGDLAQWLTSRGAATAFWDERRLHEELAAVADRVESDSEARAGHEYIVVIGLDRARRISVDRAAQDYFKALALDGPFAGIHLLAWWKSAEFCRQQTGKPESLFTTIVGLRIQAEELSRLMKTRKTPGHHRALLSSSGDPGRTTLFIPYDPAGVHRLTTNASAAPSTAR